MTKYEVPNTPKILLSLHHVYSRPDIYGNVYWITYATSTLTGKTYSFSTPHDSNSKAMAMQATGSEWGRLTNTEEQVGSRKYWQLEKTVDARNSCQDENITRKLHDLACGRETDRD